MPRVTEIPVIDPTTYAYGDICNPSPWHDPILTHPSLNRFTPIIRNHESPPWPFPKMEYLPEDHCLWHKPDSSGDYFSPNNIVPQDLGHKFLVPPLIVPPPPHLYLDLKSHGVIIFQCWVLVPGHLVLDLLIS